MGRATGHHRHLRVPVRHFGVHHQSLEEGRRGGGGNRVYRAAHRVMGPLSLFLPSPPLPLPTDHRGSAQLRGFAFSQQRMQSTPQGGVVWLCGMSATKGELDDLMTASMIYVHTTWPGSSRVPTCADVQHRGMLVARLLRLTQTESDWESPKK